MATLVSGRAGQVFQPRTPISRRDALAGRWEQLKAINDAVSEVGLHVVIFGERGVGKSSVANIIRPLLHVFDEPNLQTGQEGKRLVVVVNANSDDTFSSLWLRAFDEVSFENDVPKFGLSSGDSDREVRSLQDQFGLPETINIDDVRRSLSRLPGSVFVFDEFDRVSGTVKKQFTDLIKTLSDRAVNTTVVIVGVSETVDDLVADHASISRAIVQIPMPRMTRKELGEILSKAESALGITFEKNAGEHIVAISQGLPHYVHLIGQNAVRCACDSLTTLVASDSVQRGCVRAVESAQQSVRTSYSNATHSAHSGALYIEILLACAIAAYQVGDEQGYFQAVDVVDPLSILLGKEVNVSTFNKHLAEFTTEEKRGKILHRKGQPRSYRYRFSDPLMPPYVFLKGSSDGLITDQMRASLSTHH